MTIMSLSIVFEKNRKNL